MTGVRRASKHEVVMALRERNWAASRQERSQILDTVVEATGYDRKRALSLVRQGAAARAATPAPGSAAHVRSPGDRCTHSGNRGDLMDLWQAAGSLPSCAGTRRRGASDTSGSHVPPLALSCHERSPARSGTTQGQAVWGGTTKPGSLLKRQIPIKTCTTAGAPPGIQLPPPSRSRRRWRGDLLLIRKTAASRCPPSLRMTALPR